MLKIICPVCKSDDCTTIQKDGKNVIFCLLPLPSKGKLPHGSLKVNVVRCHNCNYIWLKLTDSQADTLNQNQIHAQAEN